MQKENYFILETFDEETNMRVQFHYWTEGDKCYSSTELEDGTTRWQGEISESEYVSALETLHNA
jgi:hypothetical protein